jgi:hypothetical protein
MTGLVLLIACMAFGWAVCYITLNFVVDAMCRPRKARAEASASCLDVEVRRKLVRSMVDEDVLLGPVSAWVAEGEARAVREWERKRPDSNAEPPADVFDIRMTTIRL